MRGPGERARRLSPMLAGGQRRFAEPIFDASRERIIAVVEEHGAPGKEPENSVATVGYGSRTGRFEVLLSGQHFYSSLRLSPDGARLAWLSWRHPCMPWDGTELWVAELDGRGLPKVPRRIAGGAEQSIFPTGVGSKRRAHLHLRSDWILETCIAGTAPVASGPCARAPRTSARRSGCLGCPRTVRFRTGTCCAPSPRVACGGSDV